MTAKAWTEAELAEVDGNDEVEIASLRPDGELGGSRTIWAVSLDGRVYVRSVNGERSVWYRATRHRHAGRLAVGSVVADVAMHDLDHADGVEDRIDAAYRTKYAGYPGPVARITASQARATTLELTPR
ncbi:hypothetical protein ABIA32_001006 [Streptacidiphilus sp. MAP12-20]|uniref:DUF2255 family protein n=1 Tax=Streptacidiphilus sp. MAP12-20 TaxID=3156299 RepID=UPI00351634EE